MRSQQALLVRTLVRIPAPALRLLAVLVAMAGMAVAATGDRYALPAAAGDGDGRDWANAQAATGDALVAAWNALPPGATLHLGSGTYPGLRLRLAGGGEPGRPRTLAGIDTGAGLPLLTGEWTRELPAKGADAIVLEGGAAHLVIRGLRLRAWRVAVLSSQGRHRDLALEDLAIEDVRSGIELTGGTDRAHPELASRGLRIERCSVTGFTKRGLRLKQGNQDVLVQDCQADAGGRAYAVEPFQMGFAIEGDDEGGLADRDVRFVRCVARNAYDDAGDGYWNGDGFCAEGGVSGLRFTDCAAHDNTDGGWDDKSTAPVYERCVASGNKRNFRLWGAGGTLTACTSERARRPGGNGGAAGLWVAGSVVLDACQLLDNPLAIELDKKRGSVVLRAGRLRRAAPEARWWKEQDAHGITATDVEYVDPPAPNPVPAP